MNSNLIEGQESVERARVGLNDAARLWLRVLPAVGIVSDVVVANVVDINIDIVVDRRRSSVVVAVDVAVSFRRRRRVAVGLVVGGADAVVVVVRIDGDQFVSAATRFCKKKTKMSQLSIALD